MNDSVVSFDDLFEVLDDYKKPSPEPPKNENNSIYFCDNCHDETIKNIKGELICTRCSKTSGIYIDSSAEWRYYGSEDSRSSDPNRGGMPTSSNSLLKEFYLGSIISSRYNESYEMKIIRKRNIWISSCYREKSLITVFESMSSRAKKYGIPNCIIEEAKYIYKQVSELKISRGENRVGIIASCLYISCCTNNSRRSTKEIAEIFMIPHTSMTKGFKKFYEIILSVKPEMVKDCILDISNSLDFINRYCSNLSKFDDKHTQLCYYMCSKIEDEDIVSENTPSSRAAGCICLVSYLFGLNESKKKIAEVCKTSEVTISKCFNKLIEYYIILVPENMLRFLALDFIHKYSQNLIKYYNSQVYDSFLRSTLKLFNKSIKLKLLEENYHVTILGAAVVYMNVKEFNFSNLGLDDICNHFNLKESNFSKIIELYIEKIKKIL